MQRFGYAAARGSTSRGGVKALVQLKRLVAAGPFDGVHRRRPARPGGASPARRPLAREGDRSADPSLSHRGRVGLARSELGSRPGAQAVLARRRGGRTAVLRRRGRSTMPPSSSAGRISKRNSRGWNSAPPRCCESGRRVRLAIGCSLLTRLPTTPTPDTPDSRPGTRLPVPGTRFPACCSSSRRASSTTSRRQVTPSRRSAAT